MATQLRHLHMQRSIFLLNLVNVLGFHCKQFMEIWDTAQRHLSQVSFCFNLENIYYYSSCSGGTISLHQTFTPSLR